MGGGGGEGLRAFDFFCMKKESKITKPDYDHNDMIILIMSDYSHAHQVIRGSRVTVNDDKCTNRYS